MNWFEKFFKFDFVNYSEGEIGFQVGQALWLFGVILVLLIAGFCIVYFLTNAYTSNKTKAVSLGLRIPALLLLCLPLFEPVLVSPDVVPDENFVAVLVDVSESMNIPDGTFGETRSDDVRHLLFDEDDGLLGDLDEHFMVRYYTFSGQTQRVDSIRQAVLPEGHETNLTNALDRVLTDFKGIPLAGVVLLTDGGDNSADVPLNKAEELRNLGIPLHIIGLGGETFAEEREILDVTVSKGVEETTGAEVDVKVRSWIDEAEPVTFNIFRGDELVFSESKRLKGDGRIDQFTFFYEPQEQGAQEYEVRIDAAQDELNTANNAIKTLIDTRKDTIRVLYFEGHLRSEFKFIKRALEDDRVVDFTSISRTGTGKMYRQGIKTPDELAGGFPTTEEDLFKFKAILLGDVEASAFSLEQLQLIEKFVRVRGGGFLMLGGRNTFAEGNYWDGPIADVLPVELDLNRRLVIPPQFVDIRESAEDQGFSFTPTAAGYESPILKLASDPSANQSRWSVMPGLTSINYLGAIKPGALVLAEKPDDRFGPAEPLLVVQRYGRGRSAALATASTWRWQMQLDVNDRQHERFWRQLVRWLTASARSHVSVDLDQYRVAPGDEMLIQAYVYDDRYLPQDDVSLRALLSDPFGGIHEVVVQPELTEAGTYTTTYSPQDEGVYELEVFAEKDGVSAGSQKQSFLVRPSNKEYYNATLKRSFLENLAGSNNGFYYEPGEAETIPTNLRSRRTSTSVFRAEYVWDMPLLFGLVLLLLSIEWIYRRRKGLS